MIERTLRTPRPYCRDSRVLAIETSCDDTCAAVIDGEGRILSSVVSSQGIHGEYLGVVPELASREHLNLILPAINQALAESGTRLGDVDGIAVTRGPGLIGCLLVGMATAKGLSLSLEIPFVGVNHIEGHLHAVRGVDAFEPPFIALVASGGHTELLRVETWDRCALLGSTRDDAAGEAFDKVAKLLGLGFPGGPAVDRLAREGNPSAVEFPRAWLEMDRGGLEFSFSGLKTAVKKHVERNGMPPIGPDRDAFVRDVCASFQAALLDVLEGKIEAACLATGIRRILISGGVACNSELRRRVGLLAVRLGGQSAYPPPSLCSDNAAMIGLAGLSRLRAGESDPMDLPAAAGLEELEAIAARSMRSSGSSA